MRYLAQLTGKSNTERFVAYLLSENISAHVEPESSNKDLWEIWIRDEDKLAQARQAFAQFEANPTNERYTKAIEQADSIIRQRREKAAASAKLQRSSKQVFSRTDLVGGRIPPVTLTLLILAAIVSLLTQFADPSPTNSLGRTMLSELRFVDISDYAKAEKDPAASLRKFEFWRLITPIFLHMDPLHIIFNAFMLVSLGRLTERLEGPLRFALIVLGIAIFSNMLQGLLPENLMGSPFFGGLSGVVYGLFGYIWVKTTLNPSLGIALSPTTVIILLAWLFLNMAGVFDLNIANMAHLGGLISGAGLAYFQSNWSS